METIVDILLRENLRKGLDIKIAPADAPRCPRCRNLHEEIGTPRHDSQLCDRCRDLLAKNERRSYRGS